MNIVEVKIYNSYDFLVIDSVWVGPGKFIAGDYSNDNDCEKVKKDLKDQGFKQFKKSQTVEVGGNL